jgi:hypothetical protein
MINLKVLGAVVIAASALSSSAALAQWASSNPDVCQAEFKTCTGLGAGFTPNYGYRRLVVYRRPVAAAAAATVGGWSNSYAMYGGYGGNGWNGMYGPNGWYGNWSSYAARNGIVCQPGTLFKGGDGLQHLCQ